MNIGIDARSLEGPRTGVGRYLLNLLEQWACTSEHRFILYFKNNAPLFGVLERTCYIKKILKASLGLESNFFFQHFLLPAAAKKDKVDVLFSPSYILPWNWRKKCIVAIHDVSYEVYPEQISLVNKFLLSKASRRSAQIASRILAVSEFSKQEIIKYYKIPPEKISVIPLGVDEKFQVIKSDKKINSELSRLSKNSKTVIASDSFDFTQDKFQERSHMPEADPPLADNPVFKPFSLGLLRRGACTERSECAPRNDILGHPRIIKKKYNLKDDYIISVGSIFRRRHLPQVIMGFSKTANKFGNLQFLIIGKNHTHPFIDIEKLIRDVNQKLNRPAIVHFDHADDDDLLWLYNGAKLLIYLSDYEGFGLPPLEAARCGVPTIVSNIPVEKEVMGEAAVFIDDNNNSQEIADKIERVLVDEGLRNDIIKKGLERVKMFSWKKCAEKTLEAIVDI